MFDIDRLGEWRSVYENRRAISALSLSSTGYLFIGCDGSHTLIKHDVNGKWKKPQTAESPPNSTTVDGSIDLDGPICAIYSGDSHKTLAATSHNTLWAADFSIDALSERVLLHGFHSSSVGILVGNHDRIAPGSNSAMLVTG